MKLKGTVLSIVKTDKATVRVTVDTTEYVGGDRSNGILRHGSVEFDIPAYKAKPYRVDREVTFDVTL